MGKFWILSVEDLDDYAIEEEDRGCEMCGNKENTQLAVFRYATNLSPQEDEILCEKCLKREGWERIKGVGGYSYRETPKEDTK
jgi:hypothetical protein